MFKKDMKKIITLALVGLLFIGFASFAEARAIKVKSYYRPSKGSYVQFHYRTSPNKTKLDNYSTKGNFNIFTGKKGTVNPFKLYKY